MSIYDSSPFFSSPFVESAVFLADSVSETEPITISVVVNRCELKSSGFKNSNIQSVSYPLTVDIQKSEVPTITKMVNKITVKNQKYFDETLLIKDVVYSDEYIWRVAL